MQFPVFIALVCLLSLLHTAASLPIFPFDSYWGDPHAHEATTAYDPSSLPSVLRFSQSEQSSRQEDLTSASTDAPWLTGGLLSSLFGGLTSLVPAMLMPEPAPAPVPAFVPAFVPAPAAPAPVASAPVASAPVVPAPVIPPVIPALVAPAPVVAPPSTLATGLAAEAKAWGDSPPKSGWEKFAGWFKAAWDKFKGLFGRSK